eukprot:5787204-Lingulodinium_polyedra.AAC.1
MVDVFPVAPLLLPLVVPRACPPVALLVLHVVMLCGVRARVLVVLCVFLGRCLSFVLLCVL